MVRSYWNQRNAYAGLWGSAHVGHLGSTPAGVRDEGQRLYCLGIIQWHHRTLEYRLLAENPHDFSHRTDTSYSPPAVCHRSHLVTRWISARLGNRRWLYS